MVNLLAETQEQLRKQRKRGMPTVRGGPLFPSMGAAPQPDSIASELESSLYSEFSVDSGIGDRMYVIKLSPFSIKIKSGTKHCYIYSCELEDFNMKNPNEIYYYIYIFVDQHIRRYSRRFVAHHGHLTQVWIPINSPE